MKPSDFQLLFELMKNAKRSDRVMAQILGVSQPTVTRRRAMLEKEVIDGYTVIPKWEKLGYEILAFTFIKSDVAREGMVNEKAAEKKVGDWMMKHPNVLAAGRGLGMRMNAFMLSIHKKYSDFDNFLSEFELELGDLAKDYDFFLVNIAGLGVTKPFNLKYLAEAK